MNSRSLLLLLHVVRVRVGVRKSVVVRIEVWGAIRVLIVSLGIFLLSSVSFNGGRRLFCFFLLTDGMGCVFLLRSRGIGLIHFKHWGWF